MDDSISSSLPLHPLFAKHRDYLFPQSRKFSDLFKDSSTGKQVNLLEQKNRPYVSLTCKQTVDIPIEWGNRTTQKTNNGHFSHVEWISAEMLDDFG